MVDGDTVSQYAIGRAGALSPRPPTVPTASAGGITVSPDGRSAYVANISANSVSQYDVSPLTGALSPKTPATVSGDRPGSVVITPNGRRAYVQRAFTNTVSQYDIDPASGALSFRTERAGVPCFSFLAALVSPDGRSAYNVAGGEFGVVLQCNIDPLTGALSPKSPETVPAGMAPFEVALTPDGRSAYVTNEDSSTVSQYDVDPVSGALSAKTPASVEAGDRPHGIAVAPDGRSAYVADSGAGGIVGSGVSQYDVDPVSGGLSAKTPASVAAGNGSIFVLVAPDGRSAYVVNGVVTGGFFPLSQYGIDPLTGALAQIEAPAIVVTGSIAVGPLPRKPSNKDQCKHGGWRNFSQLKNQGRCVAPVGHGK